MRIHPDANEVDAGPKRRIHGDPLADGGATISAPDQSCPRGCDVALDVGGSAIPLAR
jgi:hypothetical protein